LIKVYNKQSGPFLFIVLSYGDNLLISFFAFFGLVISILSFLTPYDEEPPMTKN